MQKRGWDYRGIGSWGLSKERNRRRELEVRNISQEIVGVIFGNRWKEISRKGSKTIFLVNEQPAKRLRASFFPRQLGRGRGTCNPQQVPISGRGANSCMLITKQKHT